MKIIATLHCEECGETWNITKKLKNVEDEDLMCCGEYATVEKSFKSEEDEQQSEDEV